MKKTSSTIRIASAESIARKADKGEDISSYFSNNGKMMAPLDGPGNRFPILYNVGTEGWFIGFACPAHGRSGAVSREWQPLIDEVIEIKTREGFDIAAALAALRDARG